MLNVSHGQRLVSLHLAAQQFRLHCLLHAPYCIKQTNQQTTAIQRVPSHTISFTHTRRTFTHCNVLVYLCVYVAHCPHVRVHASTGGMCVNGGRPRRTRTRNGERCYGDEAKKNSVHNDNDDDENDDRSSRPAGYKTTARRRTPNNQRPSRPVATRIMPRSAQRDDVGQTDEPRTAHTRTIERADGGRRAVRGGKSRSVRGRRVPSTRSCRSPSQRRADFVETKQSNNLRRRRRAP